MFRYICVLGFTALQLVSSGIVKGQESGKVRELPNVPIAERSQRTKQESLAIMSEESAEHQGLKQEAPKPEAARQEGAKQEDASQKKENALHSTIEILGRRSIFFPDLAASKQPLTVRQKLELFADKSIAPSRMLSSLAGSGISQAANTLPGYGQGGDGYAKRFGSSMASEASNHFFGTFLIPSMLHDDPRYFVKLHAGLGGRIGYALSRLVVTRKDDGERAANWPGMIAPLLAESLANSYLPTNERTAGRTFRRYGVRLGLTAAGNLAKEYWPTIFRGLRITRSAPNDGKS